MKIRFGDFRYGAPKAGVSNPAPGGLVSCRVQLQPRLNTPEPAYQGLTRHTRNLQAGVLKKVGAKLCRTPALRGHGDRKNIRFGGKL